MKNPRVCFLLGKVLEETGDVAASMQCFQAAIKLNPEYHKAVIHLANVKIQKFMGERLTLATIKSELAKEFSLIRVRNWNSSVCDLVD